MRFLLISLLVAMGTALAAPGTFAAEDPYTVSGIKVDATAQSAIVAQTMAINSGRAKAWQMLYRRLTKQQDWARQPALDDNTLQRLVRSYQARDQRSSTTRFVANMTYVFNAVAVRRILQQANVAYSDTVARPILVIPLGPGWSAQSPWTRAWKDPRFGRGAVPLILPVADDVNAPTLAALNFDSVAWQDIEPMASRIHATEAYVVLVIPQHAQMIIKIRRLPASGAVAIPDLAIPVPPKTPAVKAFATVADAAASAITDFLKSRSVVDFGKHSKLLVSLRFNTLGEWVQAREELDAVPTVSDVSITAIDTGEARLAISYFGSTDQLSEQLARAGFALSNESGQWWLKRSDAGARP